MATHTIQLAHAKISLLHFCIVTSSLVCLYNCLLHAVDDHYLATSPEQLSVFNHTETLNQAVLAVRRVKLSIHSRQLQFLHNT